MKHTEAELKFFKMYNIKKEEYCERVYQDGCFKNCPLYKTRKKECAKFQSVYPEMTDRMYLELYVIFTQFDYPLSEFESVEDFKEEVLVGLMSLYITYQQPYFSSNLKSLTTKVRKLF